MYYLVNTYKVSDRLVNIGMTSHGHRLAFSHQDSWACSADPHCFDAELLDSHFFFPAYCLSATGPGALMLGIFSPNGNIAFVRRDGVAVIQKRMEHFESG